MKQVLLKSKEFELLVNKPDYEMHFKRNVKMNDNVADQKLGFLKFLRDAKGLEGLGIDLYEKKESSNQWIKLGLSRNGKNITETPCN